METIRIENLSTGYHQKGSGDNVVMSNIQISISSGELTCLIGSNGIGKSTLLRTLSAFQPPLSGDIYLEGKPLSHFSNKELAREISVVLTNKLDVQNMTVEELVGLGRSPYTNFFGRLSSCDNQIVEEAISLVEISKLKGRMIQNLSDGERQKVMIAKALAQQTPIIFLDEPTAFLDFPSKVEMLKLLFRLAHDRNKTILVSTHDLELASRYADTILQMDGQGIHRKTKEEVKKEIESLLQNS